LCSRRKPTCVLWPNSIMRARSRNLVEESGFPARDPTPAGAAERRHDAACLAAGQAAASKPMLRFAMRAMRKTAKEAAKGQMGRYDLTRSRR